MAYSQLEPFGEERADLRSGIVSSTIANANRDPKKKRKAFRPQDFMPSFEEVKEEKQSSWQSMLSTVEMLNTAFGGKDLRK